MLSDGADLPRHQLESSASTGDAEDRKGYNSRHQQRPAADTHGELTFHLHHVLWGQYYSVGNCRCSPQTTDDRVSGVRLEEMRCLTEGSGDGSGEKAPVVLKRPILRRSFVRDSQKRNTLVEISGHQQLRWRIISSFG